MVTADYVSGSLYSTSMERRLSTGGSCQAVWGREGLAAALDHAAPADIARKLLRRRALEAHHPELQAALAGIDVLDVTAAGRWLARDREEAEWPRTANGELAMDTQPLDLDNLLRESEQDQQTTGVASP